MFPVGLYDDSLLFSHIGIQLVPADLPINMITRHTQALKSSYKFQAAEVTTHINEEVFLDVLCQLINQPFHFMFLRENLDVFKHFRLCYRNSKFIRISSTLKKEKNGR